jgi:ankyrin repeat protein
VGNTLYSCPHCVIKTAREDNLNRHIRNYHGANNLLEEGARFAETNHGPLASPQLSTPVSINCDSTQIYSSSLLFQAATLGDLTLLEACFVAGVTLEAKADDGSTALHCAARAGQTAAAHYLLGKGAVFEVYGRTPLHEAILSSNAETFGLLLQHLSKTTLLADVPSLEKCLAQSGNPDVVQLYIDHLDAAGERRDTPQRILAAASHLGKSSIVTMLLRRTDVDVNKREKGIAPIHSAARNGHVELMKILLSQEETDVNITTHYMDKTPLLIAASKGKSEIVNLLLAHPSILINTSSGYHKYTPLHIATTEGHVGVVRQLVAHKAIDINASTRNSMHTSLYMAAEEGRVDIVKLLAAHEAIDLNCLDCDKQTPLHAAARRGHLEVTQLLLDEPNIDTQCQDGSQVTVLHHAAFNGKWQVVQLLLEYSKHSGSDSCTRDLSSRLDVTANVDVVQRLLYHPDFRDGHIFGGGTSKQSLLHSACKRGDCDAIRVLLAYEGINVNVPGYHGSTPLMLAVGESHLEAVRLLLQHDGIDINQIARSHNGTALSSARNYSNQDMVDLLLSHGAIDGKSNPPTTTQHVTNTPIATTPNNAPETVPSFHPEPFWDDFMNDSPIEEWETSLDTELGIFETG